MKKFLILIGNIYARLFSKKYFYTFNKFILHICLKSIGYKNFGNTKDTGEEFVLKKLSSFKIKYCLDIGAHNGHYSEQLLKIENSKVIAFEPMEGSFRNLKKLEIKYPNRFKAFNYALGEKNVKKDLFYINDNSQLTTFINHVKKMSFTKKYKFKKKNKTLKL